MSGPVSAWTCKHCGHRYPVPGRRGFTESAVARARKKLGIISESSGFPRRSAWSLPVSSPADPQSVHPVSSPLGESELTDMTDMTEGVSPVVSVESVSSCLQEPRTDWTTKCEHRHEEEWAE